MKTIQELATELVSQKANEREKQALALDRTKRHKDLLRKSDELKLNQVVQSKLLSDQLSSLLGAILKHLQSQKPEITKKDVILGIDQLITNIRKINETIPKELKSLGKIVDKPKEQYWTEARLTKVLKASQPKPIDIKFPDPVKEIKVTDWEKVVSLLERIVKKPDFEKTNISIPPAKPFPKEITVDNLGEVVDKLTEVISKQEKYNEQPTGFSWDLDKNGNLATFTEIYPSGAVISSGWNVARVKVQDDRNH